MLPWTLHVFAEKMEVLQRRRAQDWSRQMDSLTSERRRLAALLSDALQRLETITGVFLIKPVISYPGNRHLRKYGEIYDLNNLTRKILEGHKFDKKTVKNFRKNVWKLWGWSSFAPPLSQTRVTQCLGRSLWLKHRSVERLRMRRRTLLFLSDILRCCVNADEI